MWSTKGVWSQKIIIADADQRNCFLSIFLNITVIVFNYFSLVWKSRTEKIYAGWCLPASHTHHVNVLKCWWETIHLGTWVGAQLEIWEPWRLGPLRCCPRPGFVDKNIPDKMIVYLFEQRQMFIFLRKKKSTKIK